MERAEAIKILKYRHDISLPFEREALETLIPELKESEDERIRKALLDYYGKQCDMSDVNGVYAYEVCAWLEKQKEQPKEEIVYRLNGLMQEYIKEGKDEAEKEHRFKCYQLFWNALEDADFFEQKEQKPAEWSEEDEKKIAELKTFIARCNGFNKENRKKAFDMIDAIGPKPSWKPSEEELVALTRVGGILRDYGHSELAKMVFMIEGKLANLHVLNKLIWKPSEEQMEALERCAEYLEESDNEDADILAGLYEQLKQL